MKIGLDFDGVFCDAEKLLQDGAKKKFGIDIPKQKTMNKDVVKEGLLTQKDFDELRLFSFEDFSNGLDIVALENVDTACRFLIEKGHCLQIITKRNSGVLMAKLFCERLGLKLQIVGMKPGQPKSSVLAGFDVFLDDCPKNIEDVKSVVPNPFLFSWSYNRDSYFDRTDSWIDFVRKIS